MTKEKERKKLSIVVTGSQHTFALKVECCPTARAVEDCWTTEIIRVSSVTIQGSNKRVQALSSSLNQ
ncbi:hypothetical protein BpHYR1_029591 [Brachionus plicatilis]|uniref:Uncharacterized protein n=1 Tax=Brachionus plicatilis TaxID=10195 RepID=A0A3M7SKD6_BRAPC|nr:hypothetical protein BpHYR1_029591 [Brachionus plicatilis]